MLHGCLEDQAGASKGEILYTLLFYSPIAL
jgi:hypothetical protein